MELSVREKFKEAANETRLACRNYWLNREFLLGNQWLYYDEQTNRPVDMQGGDMKKVKGVINRMATNNRTNMANLNKNELKFEVRPNGADDASTYAAHVSTEVLYGLHSDHDWPRLRSRISAGMLQGGTVGMSLSWDEEADDSIETPLSIAEFVVEPGTRDAETARWWIQAQSLPPEELQAMYGLKEAPAPDATAGLNSTQSRMLASHQSGSIVPLTLVLTYYERPNPLNTKGSVITEINGETVEKLDWPFPFTDRLNLVVGIETEVPERWYGETIYTQARWPQVGLNVSQSNLAEHLKTAAAAKLLVPHSAIRTMEAFNDVPGNMYPYNDKSEKPSWLQPAQLPSWLQSLPMDFARHIDDIMGTHAVSRGDAPANLESGTAISILSDMDGTPVGHALTQVAGMFTRASRMLLQMHEAFSTGTKHGILPTEEGPMATEWTGKDIHGQYDARVPADLLIPRSRAQQQQLSIKMMEMGLITNLRDFVAFSEMPGGRDLVEAVEPEVAHARREHRKFAVEEIVLPEAFHDHPAHILEHRRFRSSPLFERLTPEGKEKVHLHLAGHENFEAENLAQDVARQTADPNMAALTGATQLPAPPGGLPPEAALPAPEPEAIVPPDPGQSIQDLLGEL